MKRRRTEEEAEETGNKLMLHLAIATCIFVLSTLSVVGRVWGASPLVPDCSALEPPECHVIPDVDDEGHHAYTSYLESCPNHVCVQVAPILPPLRRRRRLSSIQITSSSTTSAPITNLSSTSPLASSSEVDIETNILNPLLSHPYKFQNHQFSVTDPWFCAGLDLNYTTRVEANTGFPPGYKEDAHARCHFMRLQNLQTLGDCRHLRYSCRDCQSFYRNWLCALAFPRCLSQDTSTPMLKKFRRVDNIALSNNDINTINMMKPCRALCFGVLQTCQQYMKFFCPETDMRDYGDYPNCNTLGLENQVESYVVSIYR
ncbi:uncharacterized protein [Physcomitrium patens]|uniref:uncharacterized protein isoform X1 n=1 Tax=Physcomitrium patens TaxID=3218 RepID=UPI000D153282|nr:uncharacterized protein LOC112294357 [Physcomitrium patens]|eukprot:XP_024400449.1 uncharacterized protein LOC112294357 [Physcomitrella patens]